MHLLQTFKSVCLQEDEKKMVSCIAHMLSLIPNKKASISLCVLACLVSENYGLRGITSEIGVFTSDVELCSEMYF